MRAALVLGLAPAARGAGTGVEMARLGEPRLRRVAAAVKAALVFGLDPGRGTRGREWKWRGSESRVYGG